MAKVESKNKQNPKLVQSELQDGRASLALEYYLGRNETPVLDEDGSHVLYTEGAMKGKPKYKIRHIRKREVLNLYIWLHPRNQQERNQNKNTLALAEKIRFEREQEFLEDREGYRLKKDGENDFIKYFRKHCENELYSKPVRCTYKTSCNRFLKFLETTPRFQRYTSYLRMELITPEMVTAFTDYLKKVAKGEGAHKSYYMFRTVILHAIEEGLMKKNPCKGIVIHRDVNTLKKEILTMEEIKRLASTYYEGEDTALKRAFLFCCFTGIRWCDAVSLTFANVDFSARILRFNQQKREAQRTQRCHNPIKPCITETHRKSSTAYIRKDIQYHLLPDNSHHTFAEMGQGGRYQQDYHMALRAPQFCSKCFGCRSEYQDRRFSHGAFEHKDDREISPCHRPAKARRNQQPRRLGL